MIPTNEFGVIEVVETPPSKRQNISDSRKKKGIMPLIPKNPMILESEDVEIPEVRKNEEDSFEPVGVEEETSGSYLIDFPIWTVNFKRKRSNQGKEIIRRESSANSLRRGRC